MDQATKCPRCGTDNPPAARFCGGCGEPLDEVRCPACGVANSRDYRFCTACGKPLGKGAGGDGAGLDELKVAAAQRRLLTILFCDLVNSTGITEALDPERMRGIIRAFQGVCKGVVGEYGGRITEYLGDGVVIQFTGHENSAERAVRSALEITRRVSATEVPGAGLERDRLSLRSGIATGIAIVGDRVGVGGTRIESSIGLPSNLAKRVQGLAQPNEVLVTDETRRLVSGLFHLWDIGWHQLKGFRETRRVWRVLGEADVDFRFEAARTEIPPMVDREEVMETLLRRWGQVEKGEGQVVLLTGEPGIGKSRIVEEMDRQLAETPHVQLRYQCSACHTHTALYPVIARISRAAGFRPGDSPAARFRKLERFLRETRDDLDRAAPLYASLLSLPTGGRYPPLELPPEALRRETLRMLAQQVTIISAVTPLLIQVEDLQWADPTSLELLDILVQIARDHAVLLLLTARPDFVSDIVNLPHVSALVINRLPEHYTRELVEQVWTSPKPVREYVEEIAKRSEGIPLFAEELSKNLLDELRKGREPPVESLGIPVTLQDSLLARLDRLSASARTTAQVAAAIGREFSPGALRAVIGVGKEEMYRRLDELMEAGVVYPGVTGPQKTLVFKHALMQDAAYESLLMSDRREIHRRIADAAEREFPAVVEAQPEMLARHWTEAGEKERAIPYWLAAGQRASERFANPEAANHLRRGLELVESLPGGRQRDSMELEFRNALAPVLRMTEGAGAERTQFNVNRAVELCARLPESPQHFLALWSKWQNSMNFRRDLGLEWTARLQALAGKLGDPGFMVQAHHAQWTTLFHVGRFAEAFEHVQKGLDLYDEQAHARHAARYGGHDPRVCGGGFAAHALWMLGFPDRSLEYAEKCDRWAGRLNQPGSGLHVIELSLLLFQFRRQPARLAPWIGKLERVCKEYELPEYAGKLQFNRGWLLANRGNAEGGIEQMGQGLEKQRAVGSLEDVPLFSERLAKVLADNGRVEEGLGCLERALKVAEEYGLRYWLAEVHRRRGELLRSMGREEEAWSSFGQAMDIAREQGAKSLELRAAMSMARWQAGQGLPAEGARILQPVRDWFTEGLDTPDLKAVGVLLERLRAG